MNEKPKFRIGQAVKIKNTKGVFNIRQIEPHGDGFCECCYVSDVYFMYGLTTVLWVAESELEAQTIN